MREIKTAAVIGAGAIGGYLIHQLYDQLGNELWVIADGERKHRLETGGIRVNGRDIIPTVKTPAQARGADILFVSVKYTALADVLDDIAAVCDKHTIVMSLLNGVDSEDRIAEMIGMEHVLDAVIKVASRRTDEGIVFEPPLSSLGITFGERSGEMDSARVRLVSKLFERTGIPYHRSENIIRDIWLKYAINIGQNIPQAIIGCGMGACFDSTHVGRLREMLCGEVFAVAAERGIVLPEGSAYVKASEVMKTTRFSTLQDLDAGRHTEIGMLCGTLVRLAESSGLKVPYNEMAYHIIKGLEEKNDGRFDYI